MCRHALILLPLIVATIELIGPLFNAGRNLVCLALIVVLLALVPKKCRFRDWQRILPSALLSAGGALTTFFLANHLGLGPLVASALVGLVGAIFFVERYQLILYLGTFVGMTSSIRFPSITFLIVAGVVGGALWEILSDTWNGVGGRLGTVAAAAVLVVLLTLGGGL